MLDFILVGPRKTASTWLHDVFAGHKSLQIPDKTKETFYFDKFYDSFSSQTYEKTYYDLTRQDAIKGEFSPSYFTSEQALERIKKDCPNVKIIICIREPVERLISDYLHHIRYGKTKSSILQAVKEDNDLWKSTQYQKYILMWKANFDNVKIIYYEDLLADKKAFLDEICDFLDVTCLSTAEFDSLSASNSGDAYSNYYVAKLTTEISFILRKLRLLAVLNFFKSIGLKKILLRSKKVNKNELVTDEEINVLTCRLANESVKYENRSY